MGGGGGGVEGLENRGLMVGCKTPVLASRGPPSTGSKPSVAPGVVVVVGTVVLAGRHPMYYDYD